jgi:hypothetical protein
MKRTLLLIVLSAALMGCASRNQPAPPSSPPSPQPVATVQPARPRPPPAPDGSIRVIVGGVDRGTYPWTEGVTLISFMAVANRGDELVFHGRRFRVVLARADGTVRTLDYSKILMGRQPDPQLKSGDVLGIRTSGR